MKPMILIAALVVAGCGNTAAEQCVLDAAAVRAEAEALNMCAQTRGCLVTSESVVSFYAKLDEIKGRCSG